MNVQNILTKISDRGLIAKGELTEAGPVIKVKIPGENKCICGLVPIDNESDDRFADYLIAEVKKVATVEAREH